MYTRGTTWCARKRKRKRERERRVTGEESGRALERKDKVVSFTTVRYRGNKRNCFNAFYLYAYVDYTG